MSGDVTTLIRCLVSSLISSLADTVLFSLIMSSIMKNMYSAWGAWGAHAFYDKAILIFWLSEILFDSLAILENFSK